MTERRRDEEQRDAGRDHRRDAGATPEPQAPDPGTRTPAAGRMPALPASSAVESPRAAVGRMIEAAAGNAGDWQNTCWSETMFPRLRDAQPEVLAELRRYGVNFRLQAAGSARQLVLTVIGDPACVKAFGRIVAERRSQGNRQDAKSAKGAENKQ